MSKKAESSVVLIIDDDPNFLEIFKTKLGALGLTVETAASGEEGTAKAKKLKPALILLDMQMPGMSGADALLKLRGQPETETTKVVFLTSFGDIGMESPEALIAKQLGASDYLKKTDDLDVLAEKIKTFL